MNYTELCVNIQDICENEFSSDELAMFTEQAEQKIYNTVQIPALRKNVTGTMSAGNQYLQIPSDFLYCYSLAVIDETGEYHYLLNKDMNFITALSGRSNSVEGTRFERGIIVFSDDKCGHDVVSLLFRSDDFCFVLQFRNQCCDIRHHRAR